MDRKRKLAVSLAAATALLAMLPFWLPDSLKYASPHSEPDFKMWFLVYGNSFALAMLASFTYVLDKIWYYILQWCSKEN